MTLAELQAQRDAILHLAARAGASNVRVYGPQGMDSVFVVVNFSSCPSDIPQENVSK